MCYKVSTASDRKLRAYLEKTGADVEVQPFNEHYHANAFNFGTTLPVQLNTEPKIIQPAYWKLIPFWVKDLAGAKGHHGTENARSDNVFTAKSYERYIPKYRALLWVDGFYEPHHAYNPEHQLKTGKKPPKTTSYPYFVYRKDHEPFTLGCVWAPWTDRETGEYRATFSIITTDANKLLATIHNEKLRMPYIVPEHDRARWLSDISTDEIKQMMQPLPDGELTAHPVTRDINKGTPDYPEIQEFCDNGLNLQLENL